MALFLKGIPYSKIIHIIYLMDYLKYSTLYDKIITPTSHHTSPIGDSSRWVFLSGKVVISKFGSGKDLINKAVS